MEDESETPQSSDNSQNLNDLQNYLVHFNKEIGSGDGGGSFQQKFISHMISVAASDNTTPTEEELPAITGDYYILKFTRFLTLCIPETVKGDLLQTVKTLMKCSIMLHFIRVTGSTLFVKVKKIFRQKLQYVLKIIT